jgi:predicted Zn-dependent peptidase
MTVSRTVLDNGVTVLSERVPHLLSVTAGIWVPAGSRSESPQENGITHFIEHMLFKGTARRSAIDIARAIESVGGTMNACTDREYTFFFVKALAKDFALAVDLLSDICLGSVFDEREIEREKDVVLQEILMVEDTPEECLHDVFHAAYWSGHPLGLPIQGTVETVSALTRGRLVARFSDRFRRRGVIAAVVGNLPHERIVDVFARALSPLRLAEPNPPSPPPDPARGVFLRGRPFEQLHLCLGAPAVPRSSERRYAAHVLSAILGGSASSRLFQEVREKRGLAYSVYATLSAYADAGILKICAGTTADKAEGLLSVVADVVGEVRDGRIDDDEVSLARELIKGSMLLSLESAEYRMSRIALNEMFLGREEPPEEALRRVDGVTTNGVRDMAAELLPEDRFVLAAVGDLPDGAGLAFGTAC